MFCTKCGNDMGDAKFCIKCGNKATDTESQNVEPVTVENVEPATAESVAPVTYQENMADNIPQGNQGKKKKVWPKVAAVIVALVVILGAATYFAWPRIDMAIHPEKMAITALKNTTSGAASAITTAVDKASSTQLITDREIKGSYVIDKASFEGDDYLASLKVNTVNYDIKYYMADMTYVGTIGLGTSSASSDIEMKFYMDSTTMKIQIPQLYSETLSISLDSASSSAQYSQLFNLLQMYGGTNSGQIEQYSGIINAVVADVVSGLDTLIDEMQYEKIGNEDYESENGTIKTTVFDVTVTETQLKDCAKNIVNNIYSDTELSSYATLLSLWGVTQQSIIKEIDSTQLGTGNCTFTMYINENGIVKMIFDSAKVENAKSEFSLSAEFIGKDSPMDYVVIDAKIDDVPIKFTLSNDNGSGLFKLESKPANSGSDGFLSIGMNYKYTESDGKISCIFDDLHFNAKFAYDITVGFECSGSYDMTQITGKADSSAFSGAIDMNRMTSAQQYTFAMEIYNNISVLKKVLKDDLYNQVYESIFGISPAASIYSDGTYSY